MSFRSPPFLILASLLLASCEKPFEPIPPNDLVFSIYGHLDAAVDTQWVRVMPIREELATVDGPIDALVTIEEIETGTSVMMSDVLTKYSSVNLDGTLYAHNFSTTMPIIPGRHYRVTATRSDGAAASATVRIPVWEAPTMVASHAFLFPSSPNNPLMAVAYGKIRGSRYLAMVLGRENETECCEWRIPSHEQFLPIYRAAEFEGDDHDMRLSWDPARDGLPSYVPLRPPGHIGPKRILAIASGEPWPHGALTHLRELSHPGAINTVEGRGVGFLGGVHTYVFPYAECIPVDRNSPCTITFSPSSATLVGVVTNGCTGGPLPDVRVQLGPRNNGIRSDTTNAAGLVQFHGLEPGVAHSLAVAQLATPGDFFPLDVENVVLPEGGMDTVSIEMTQRRNCAP